MALVGRVKALWRHPVKSMLGESVDRVEVTRSGMVGDRCWAACDTIDGHVRGGKSSPVLMLCAARYLIAPGPDILAPVEIRLPGGRWLRCDDPSLEAALSALVEASVTLRPASIGPAGAFVDEAPLQLLTTNGLALLAARRPASSWDVRRFRPNLVIAPTGAGASLPERDWVGRRLRIGEVPLSVTGLTARCAMTTRPVADLPFDPAILQTIVRETGQCLGANAVALGAGSIGVGDPVELI